MAKCFDVVGYIEPCNAVRQKYTGRALLITGFGNVPRIDKGLVEFSDNGLRVMDFIGGVDDFQNFVRIWKEGGGKAFQITIDAESPFSVTVQGNTDSGRVSYTKTIPVSIPATRDGKAEEFIMGLQKGLNYCAMLVLETFGFDSTSAQLRKDVFGAYSPVRLDPTSVTRNEYENGGVWQFNLVCEEPVPNVTTYVANLSAALDTLNA